MNNPIIEINNNYVVVEGIRINRPSRIGVSQWLEYWEHAVLFSSDD